MSKKLIYSTYSLLGLQNIILHIQKDSISRANDFAIKIENQIMKLKQFPELGVKIEDNCRKLLIDKNYKVIYEIVGENINILSIVNVKVRR